MLYVQPRRDLEAGRVHHEIIEITRLEEGITQGLAHMKWNPPCSSMPSTSMRCIQQSAYTHPKSISKSIILRSQSLSILGNTESDHRRYLRTNANQCQPRHDFLKPKPPWLARHRPHSDRRPAPARSIRRPGRWSRQRRKTKTKGGPNRPCAEPGCWAETTGGLPVAPRLWGGHR